MYTHDQWCSETDAKWPRAVTDALKKFVNQEPVAFEQDSTGSALEQKRPIFEQVGSTKKAGDAAARDAFQWQEPTSNPSCTHGEQRLVVSVLTVFFLCSLALL